MKLLRRFSYFVLLLSLISCGGGSLSNGGDGNGGSNGGGTTPDPIAISLALSNQEVTRTSSVTVTATITQGNNLLTGTDVSFATDLGTLSPVLSTITTDAQGVAVITLNAGTDVGTGIITVSLSSGETNTIQFNIPPIDIALVLSNEMVTVGVSTTVTATITQGNDVLTGTDVSFTTDLGTLSPVLSTITTDAQGVAVITLNAGTDVGVGTLNAFLESGESNTIEFNIPPILISLNLSSDTVSGQAPITVNAVVSQGSSVLSGTVVNFTSTLGAFSPSSGTALTDANGVTTITLTAGNVRGAGTVTASLASGNTTKDISFTTQGDDIGIVGDININVGLVDKSGTSTQTITASKSGKLIATVNGITSPVIVTFTSTVGDIPIATAITNSDNQASVDILAGDSLGAGTVTASIATGENGQVLLVVGASNVLMGSGSPFQEGVADISLNTISAGGTTVVTVNIIDDQGSLFKEPVEVNFSSSCTSLATPSASLSSPIITSNGVATSTYLAKGCVGDDPISVNANAGGINLSAATSVNVLPASVGSIEFISATPENIGILGTGALGGAESSTVVFKVLDTNANPVNNQVVNFSLNTNVGGVALIPSSATTDNNGFVQTVINSGTVATSVRVKADIAGSSPLISSQSSVLVVSTGIPDQDSFSLSADILNVEGWDLEGSEVQVTARMADAFNNPVPDGTAVSFTTEGGSIDPSCTTLNGACTVTWRSQFPYPEGHVLIHDSDSSEGNGAGNENDINVNGATVHPAQPVNTLGQKFGGRATITATAIGEESFPDLNGNGRFDASEVAAFKGLNISGLPYDLKEAFVDHNEDGKYNPAEGGDVNNSGKLEEFMDFNNDSVFTQNDGLYNGVLCALDANGQPAHAGCSSTQKSINVRRSLVLIMSGSNGFVTLNATNDALSKGDPNINPNDTTVYIAGENTGSAVVTIADLHNQPLPAGTKINFTASAGSVVAGASNVWPNDNHNGGIRFSVSIKGEKEPKSGLLSVTIETPNGVKESIGFANIVIQ